tara:strand:- start:315 stop:1250 length:936 start_codon:yes stop_codon:yes gene_type:complete
MKFDKKTIISASITICLILLITFLVFFCECEYKNCQKCNKEGLQFYGDKTDSLGAPLAYETVMKNIKYPVSNPETGQTIIYDTDHKVYNTLLFNKINKQMHFSDEQIMKDLKHFNNSSNLLLEHYLNNNVPDSVSINVQDLSGSIPASSKLSESDISNADYYTNINFKSETTNKTPPNYLYRSSSDRPIEKEKTYIYRLSDNYNPQGSTPPTNGSYLIKNITKIDGAIEEDNLYNYDYDLSGMNYDTVYDELTNYDESLFNNDISMINPGKYSSYYFESNYSDLSDNVTKDFKYFYSTAPTIAGYGLFNKR